MAKVACILFPAGMCSQAAFVVVAWFVVCVARVGTEVLAS